MDAGEDAAASAVRELREETGYSGRVFSVSPICYSDPGMTDANMQAGGLFEHINPCAGHCIAIVATMSSSCGLDTERYPEPRASIVPVLPLHGHAAPFLQQCSEFAFVVHFHHVCAVRGDQC